MEHPDPVRLHVDVAGSGAPSVVLTHGWVDDSTVWDGVATQLRSSHEVVTWDLRGHGRSEAPPPGQYSREHALGDLARVIGERGPVVLGGHSLGGYLSLCHALRHPDQVLGLMLVASGPGFRNPESMNGWNDSVRASAANFDIPAGQEEISIHIDSWVIDSLEQIRVPTLVIVGENDKRFLASAALFEKTMDVRETVIVPGAGHAVHRKYPTEVAAAMSRFVAGLG